ncbi:MAG: 3-dehydroquinate synthase [Actinomycetota bacterium]|nr:3-dehydroquinate synthase [Actinomycetota bacterium]
MEEIKVRTAGGDYPVSIGRRIYAKVLGTILEKVNPPKVVIVSHPSIMELHASRVEEALRNWIHRGGKAAYFVFPEGEGNKNLHYFEKGLFYLLEKGFTREDLLIAFGGGVVGDLAGYLASSYQRGMRYTQLPTSLMAMVDSSIGGKVGLDLPGAKNAVGSFYQPAAVICDTEVLATLPVRELKSGLAEVVKYGFLYDGQLLREMRELGVDQEDVLEAATEVVARCVALKAEVVYQDERDLTGKRALLNYGHTFGHALESATGYGVLRHGEAVALGMMAAARASELHGLAEAGLLDMHMEVLMPLLKGVEMQTYPGLGRIVEDMGKDKKRGRDMRFVLLEGPQRPRLVESLSLHVAGKALEEIMQRIGEDL